MVKKFSKISLIVLELCSLRFSLPPSYLHDLDLATARKVVDAALDGDLSEQPVQA